MQHLDEGTIHSWLDGALSVEESARVEAHVASCESCGAMVAEARGLVAASSRILAALDNVPRNVVPASTGAAVAERGPVRGEGGFRRWQWKRIAAVIAFVAVGGTALRIAVGEFDPASDAIATAPVGSVESDVVPAEEEALKMGATVPSPAPRADERPAAPAATAAPRPPAEPMAASRRARSADVTADTEGTALSGGRAETRQQLAAPPPMPARSVVEGRVTDARTGNALPSAQVMIDGTRIGAITDDSGAFRITGAPQGEQQLRVLRLGYEALERDIETKAGETVSVAVALEPRSTLNERVVVTGQDFAAKPVGPTIIGLQALSRDTVVDGGRVVETSVYELRPGVQVTLRVVTAAPVLRDDDNAKREASQRAMARAAPSAQRLGAAVASNAVRTLSWVTPAGTEVTISGAVPDEELQRLRSRVAVP